ncbi:MAG: Acetyltransferase (isoleucine patch superfamily)-like protein [Modestobacter sp.]|nr:Acetyltransferase (isoleucine patch superfamily)-like protein [Modestobacter sp.]
MVAPDEAKAPAFTRYDMGVSPFWEHATAAERQQQLDWQAELAGRGAIELQAAVFVSPLAVVYPERLVLGERTYVSAHSYLWGDVEVGADCTLNPFTEVRGLIRIGDGVRIGAHTSILGFNHSMSIDQPIFEQPLTMRGITIGDDVWIGSHVVILDGVTVGSHSIIAAGSVVTKDVAAWSVVAGNPARPLRDRRTGPAESTSGQLRRLADTAREELGQILARGWSEPAESFTDRPGAQPTVRAWCDAVELTEMFDLWSAMPVDAQRCTDELRRRQDPGTGLVPDWDESNAAESPDGHAGVNYHILSVGYALQLLGTGFEHPISVVDRLSSPQVREALEAQPWATEGWRAGAWVDALGTAMLWNRTRFSRDTEIETLLGWLTTRCDPGTGLWGSPDPSAGWLEPVNGFYRLTRGTFAQFAVPLPYPERTIDSVLAHSGNATYFGDRRGTACNVLDVIHPLWLAGKQTNHRRKEGEDWARRQLARATRSWNPAAGFSFALEPGVQWDGTPGLLGTEMWLSITWLLADYLGMSADLGFRPRGVHRPEPATTLPGTPR